MGDHKLISCTLMVDVVASNNDILDRLWLLAIDIYVHQHTCLFCQRVSSSLYKMRVSLFQVLCCRITLFRYTCSHSVIITLTRLPSAPTMCSLIIQ